MPQGLARALLLSVALIGSAASLPASAADPSLHEIYQAAESGHLDQAQTMIGTVLADHPNSAKAHYVAAELDARQGHIVGAREQLATAERLAPGLPFAKPEAVTALRARLSGASVPTSHAPSSGTPQSVPSIPWTPIVLGALLLGLFFAWRSARRPVAYVPQLPPANGATYGPGNGPYPGTPPAGGGLGSTLATGLAGGLAAGAGIVAGEALMNRVLGNGERGREVLVRDDAAGLDDRRGNADMGGADFGVNDAGSWDDSSADAGGGDDWG
ncbi:Tetratricopeptide repeat [Solimonas aquatica]|uniref:Tetratricopeptide repeat n=1 Tax=Solimonas aquatica TaxID=489703 RepID=A0A1H9L178_9GAMM|nr:hypothetical protein [Solimonas aquatica]SER04753.1 Tetratricopeptide repeat [Solimonas aquatica]